MSRNMLRWSIGSAIALMTATGPVAAQDAARPLPPLETFGPLFQSTWISALNFTPITGTALVDFSDPPDYYAVSGSPGVTLAYVEVRLPGGAKLAAIQCLAHDLSSTANMTFTFYRSRYNFVTKATAYEAGQSVSSSGFGGFQDLTISVDPAAQLIRYEVGDDSYLYYIQVEIGNVDTRFRGCRLLWQRTVSPAAGSATFNDVPIGHPQRQFVEALAAAGITGGCGGGNYCPDAPLTRGQMAVFLAAALGLYWPF